MIENSMIVRHATPADEEALLDLYITLHREGLPRIYPYNYSKVVAGIQKATRKQGGIAGIVDDPNKPGRIAALVFLYLDSWWWSDCTFLIMRECFVRKEFRKGTGYFQALRRFAEEVRVYFDQNKPPGHPPILLEAAFVNDDEAKERLMERLWRRFGKRIGAVYLSGL